MFEVGQTVWCLHNGKGTVDEICTGDVDYPVTVIFDNGNDESYTQAGMMFNSDANRFLYFSKPEIFAETEPPFVGNLVKGMHVMVKYKNGMYDRCIVEYETKNTVGFHLAGDINKSVIQCITLVGETLFEN